MCRGRGCLRNLCIFLSIPLKIKFEKIFKKLIVFKVKILEKWWFRANVLLDLQIMLDKVNLNADALFSHKREINQFYGVILREILSLDELLCLNVSKNGKNFLM